MADWQNIVGKDSSGNPITEIKNTLQLPFVSSAGGGYKPNPSPFGNKIAFFKRDLLVSAYNYVSDYLPPVYAGLNIYRASSTTATDPFTQVGVTVL
jgi:hypothetical protein